MHRATTYKELAHRAGDGVEVSLLWRPSDGRLRVMVDDASAEEPFEVEARADNALEVFYHPYAYVSTSACALAV